MTELPSEVTDVQRLRLKPGDALVVRLAGRVTPQDADRIMECVRVILRLDESTPVLVLPEGSNIDVLDTSDEARIRDAMAEAQEHPGRVVTRLPAAALVHPVPAAAPLPVV